MRRRIIASLFLLRLIVVDGSIGVAQMITMSGHTDAVTSVGFSPKGSRVVSSSDDRTVRLWDSATGAEIATLEGHTAEVNDATFSPDETSIASASEDTTVKLWDAKTFAEGLTLSGHVAGVNCVTFSIDGKRIVTGSDDQTVKIWDVATGAEVADLVGHTSEVLSIAVGPDGKQIASGSHDGTVKVWDALDATSVLTLKADHGGPITSISFQPDGKQIVSTSSGPDARIHRWDVISGEEISEAQKITYDASLSVDGRRLAIAFRYRRIELLDAHSCEIRRVLKGHGGDVTTVAFAPDGRLLASGSDDHTVTLWNVSIELYEKLLAAKEKAEASAKERRDAAAAVRWAKSPQGRALARYRRGLMSYRLGIAGSALGILVVGGALIFRITADHTSPGFRWVGLMIVTATAVGLMYGAWI